MKMILVAGIFLFCTEVAGQQQRDTIKLNHGSWEMEAIYPGGKKALDALFAKEMRYIHAALRDNRKGIVVVGWVIDTFGCVKNIRIMKSVRADLDAEAIRLAGLQARWIPYERNKKKYKTYRKQNVVFAGKKGRIGARPLSVYR